MLLIISGDIDEASGFGEIITDFYGPTKRHFLQKNYGSGIESIVIVLMCHMPSLTLKRRVRFSKKDKMLSFDMIFDLGQMQQLDHLRRKQKIIEAILVDTPAILRKYSIPNFDEKHFMEDFTIWLESQTSAN
jgi:hypothetical protein